jgi:hypothetical protein
MTEQKKKLLKAKIAAALYHENGKVPTPNGEFSACAVGS